MRLDFLGGRFAGPAEPVYRMVERFHLDSIACGVSALACGTNAPDGAAARGPGIQKPAGRAVPGLDRSA